MTRLKIFPGLIVLLATLAACGSTETPPVQTAETPAPATPVASPEPVQAPTIVSGLPDFSALVAAYGSTVVNVTTVSQQEVSEGGAPGLSPEDPFYDFFRRFGFGTPHSQPPPVTHGEGSGFLISADGYILTNAHVVDRAREVTVRMTDRREYRAKVIGVDARTDVAVLKIDAVGLPFVRIGSPAALKAGQWVVAIGSPFGFDNSVTAGIISATARSLPGDAYTPFIQTDVAVNPGNSGGPLFNLQGDVVGINSQIYSRTGGYQGVSFAIPIDVAMHVRNQLVATGRVERGRIGVTIQDVNQALADSFRLPRPSGALISQVEAGGPADKAGLKAGDVILSVDGRAIERSGELPAVIAAIKPGNEATLDVWRNRAKRKIRVKLGELEDDPAVALRQPAADSDTGKLGLAVRPLSASERRQLHTEGRLLVEETAGPSAQAGVEPGDVLLAVNGVPVTSIGDFREAVTQSGETVALLVQRGAAHIYIPVRMAS
ncbi:MAG: DegQ family serine endoprotease [Steroidobacteraceae bacterium]